MIIFQKKPNKDFTILNISDPQLTNSDWNDGHPNRNILEYTIEQLIAAEIVQEILISLKMF